MVFKFNLIFFVYEEFANCKIWVELCNNNKYYVRSYSTKPDNRIFEFFIYRKMTHNRNTFQIYLQ